MFEPRTRNSFSFDTIFSLGDISPKTQTHLTKVYSCLMGCTAICALGMFINQHFIPSGFLLNLFQIIASIYMIYQVTNKTNAENTRMLFLGGFAFQMGFLVGPAIHMIAELHPEILFQAVVYTLTAFTSFTAVSLFSKRRSFLFLGGIISTMIQALVLYRLFGWISGYGSPIGLGYMMISLFIACIYIIYDTQIIVERAERGDKDVPTHTLMLFVDLFELFIRILQILMELNKDDKKKKK